MEIRIIISEIISSKMYYKLLTLKLTPLFNSNEHFIIFDGLFSIQKDTIISFQDFEKTKKAKEMLLSVSDPELQENIKDFPLPLKEYSSIQKKLYSIKNIFI